MSAVVKCPVCGENISVNISYRPSRKFEERYQHQDHYLYIDLPFNYVEIRPDEKGNPVKVWGLTREPKLLSDQTAFFLAKKIGVSESDIREVVRQRLEGENLEPEQWGERLLMAIQSLVSKVAVNEKEQLMLEDLLFDEGFTLTGSSLEMNLKSIDDTEVRTRFRCVQILREIYREFKEVYSHYHMTLLAVRSEVGIFALAAWIVLTPAQDFPEYEMKGDTLLLLKHTRKLDRLSVLIQQLERGKIEMDGFSVSIARHRGGSWSDFGGLGDLPREIRLLSSEGYGAMFNTGRQIQSIFNELYVDPMDFISESDERFYSFEEFSERMIGKRFDTGRNVLVHILAPYWIAYRNYKAQSDGTVLVEWSCPEGCYRSLKPLLRAFRENGWHTYKPLEQTGSTENGRTFLKSVFFIPHKDEVGFLEFIIEHPLAFRIDKKHPYLLNIGFGTPYKPDSKTASAPIEDGTLTQKQILIHLLDFKDILLEHDTRMREDHQSLEETFSKELGPIQNALNEIGDDRERILLRLAEPTNDAKFIRRMVKVIARQSYEQEQGVESLEQSLEVIQSKLDEIAKEVKADNNTVAKAKSLIGKVLRIPAAMALYELLKGILLLALPS